MARLNVWCSHLIQGFILNSIDLMLLYFNRGHISCGTRKSIFLVFECSLILETRQDGEIVCHIGLIQ